MSHIDEHFSAGFRIEVGLIDVVGKDAADSDIFCRTGGRDGHEDE